eukprot:GHVQ01019765.1.p2 GENE.GHVQ01019765.1~~GHVQ01019765.1.p2  ORF type:complete len:115 (-),score=31.70 GHVQ01019765.1:294-599(-)
MATEGRVRGGVRSVVTIETEAGAGTGKINGGDSVGGQTATTGGREKTGVRRGDGGEAGTNGGGGGGKVDGGGVSTEARQSELVVSLEAFTNFACGGFGSVG